MKLTHWLTLLAGLLLLPLLAAVPTSCTGEAYADEESVQLLFSTDTLRFDTLFTAMGSATRQLRVYNTTSSPVLLSHITLASGRSSRFRLNVDGDTSMIARHVELLAGDSLFIFVNVSINPNDQDAPFLVEDAICFSNGQSVSLTAWGRNAVYHQANDGDRYSVVDCQQWDHTRPHVVIGMAAILDGSTLTLQPGEEIYFGNDGLLAVDSNASLVAHGTAEQPILFSSLRHDGWYSFLPGQWQCLWLTSDSRGNSLDHVLIENGTGGIRVYPRAELEISNSIIRSMSDCALIGQGGTIRGTNLLVYDCLASFTALRGGNYTMRHCTMADYWNYSARTVPSVVMSNYLRTAQADEADDLHALWEECIIWGSRYDGEWLLMDDGVHAMDVQVQNCHIKGVDGAEDPLFVDPSDDDYHLSPQSPATGLGYSFSD